MSSTLAIGYGVPQGSILGLLLFVICINDLPQILLKSSIGIYVEDTIIYFSDASAEIIKQVLQNDLNHVEQWLASNRPVLNQSKTKWKLFGTRKLELLFTPQHTTSRERNWQSIKPCYLGVRLVENLSWNQHVELTCNKAGKILGLLSSIQPYLTLNAAKCVYNCLVQPSFD